MLRRYGDDTLTHTASTYSQKILSQGRAEKEREREGGQGRREGRERERGGREGEKSCRCVHYVDVIFSIHTHRKLEGGKLFSKRLLRKTNKGPKWLEKVR